jgi:hypothetical protein
MSTGGRQLYLGIPSIISVFLTRLYLVPAIPNPIVQFGTVEVSKSMGLLLAVCGHHASGIVFDDQKVKEKGGRKPAELSLSTTHLFFWKVLWLE